MSWEVPATLAEARNTATARLIVVATACPLLQSSESVERQAQRRVAAGERPLPPKSEERTLHQLMVNRRHFMRVKVGHVECADQRDQLVVRNPGSVRVAGSDGPWFVGRSPQLGPRRSRTRRD